MRGTVMGKAGYRAARAAAALKPVPRSGDRTPQMGSASDQYAALRAIADLVDAPAVFTQLAPAGAAAVRTLLAADGVWLCVRGRRNADVVQRHADGIEPRQALSGDLPIAADPLVEAAALAD